MTSEKNFFVDEAELKMKDAANKLIEIIEIEEPQKVSIDETGEKIAEVGVTVDGSWQKRGHTSKISVVFLLSVRTDDVLDYEVMSLYCHGCTSHQKIGTNSEAYQIWKAEHQRNCQINHSGFSGNMETPWGNKDIISKH